MLKILKNQVFFCSIVGLSWLSVLIIDFFGGYRGFPLALPPFLPAELVPLLIAFIFTLIVLIRGIWSIIHRRNTIISIAVITITLAFWLMPGLCPQRPFMLGFKYRILKLSSPQQLREIADNARVLISKENFLPGPGKISLWEKEEHAALWEKMPKYKIIDGNNSWVVISVSDDNSVDLSWGGALVGHWGICIGDGPIERDIYAHYFIFIEPDIGIYMSE